MQIVSTFSVDLYFYIPIYIQRFLQYNCMYCGIPIFEPHRKKTKIDWKKLGGPKFKSKISVKEQKQYLE